MKGLHWWSWLSCLYLASSCGAQTIIPQVADGGNWRTAIQLINATPNAANVSMTFFRGTTGGATEPWRPPFVETNDTRNMAIPPGGTAYLHTTGTAVSLSQGWARVTGDPGVSVHAIYTYRSFDGRPDQDGTSQAVPPAPRILVPFDNTSGFATSLAIVNPTNAGEAVAVNIQLDDGAITRASLPLLPANGQLAVVTAQMFPETIGRRGVLEFYTTPYGSIAIAAFRFNPALALTSVPVTAGIGAPVIGAVLSSVPAFASISASPGWVPDGASPAQIRITVTPNSDGTYIAGLSGFAPGGLSIPGWAVLFALQGTVSGADQAFVFNIPMPGTFSATNAALSFTLTELSRSGSFVSGVLQGTLSMQPLGNTGVLSGPITGSYTQRLPQ